MPLSSGILIQPIILFFFTCSLLLCFLGWGNLQYTINSWSLETTTILSVTLDQYHMQYIRIYVYTKKLQKLIHTHSNVLQEQATYLSGAYLCRRESHLDKELGHSKLDQYGTFLPLHKDWGHSWDYSMPRFQIPSTHIHHHTQPHHRDLKYSDWMLHNTIMYV